ncbi:MAG: tetratricopeptide repeat protein [Acidobacteriaceae bacterium]|nr:tetratricopeptide repeat protein [Acidobacteriaceae bacterium]
MHFYNNEYDQALDSFEEELKQRPADPDCYDHIAQTILYREMYRNGALESELVTGGNPFLRRPKMEIAPEDKARFEMSIDQALKLSAALLRKNPGDIQVLHAVVVAHALHANYEFLVERAWLDALHDAIAARKANEKILAIDPEWVDAHLVSGVTEYIFGSLPTYLRLLGAIRGFHGSKENGIRQLQWVAQSGILDKYDARILLAAIYRRERDPQVAIPLLEQLVRTFPRNYLFRFEQVQMYSDLGDKRAALSVLAEVESLRCAGATGYANLAPEKIEYLTGNLLFWYGDLDPALANLRRVTEKASGLDLNTAVMAWLRLGQVYDLKGDHQQAIEAYRQTVNTAPKSAAAAEAENYIDTPYRRKPNA